MNNFMKPILCKALRITPVLDVSASLGGGMERVTLGGPQQQMKENRNIQEQGNMRVK